MFEHLLPSNRGSYADRFFIDYPQVEQSFVNKASTVYPWLEQQGADPTVLRALYDLDVQRLLRGQRPLSSPRVVDGTLQPGETLQSILAATPTPGEPYGRSLAPEIRRNRLSDIPGNVASDAATIFRSIPKLPIQIVKSIADIPNTFTRIDEANGDWRKISQAPIINLIPGSYTLGNLLAGEGSQLVEHPLFTALDVLPFATAKAFKAPARMLDDAGNLANRSIYRNVFPRSTRLSIEDAERAMGLSRTADRFGLPSTPRVSLVDLALDTRLGRRVRQTVDAQRLRFRGSPPGRALQRSFGQTTRDLSIQVREVERLILDILDPDSPFWKYGDTERRLIYKSVFDVDEPAIQKFAAFRDSYGDEFGAKFYGSPEKWAQRRVELTDILETNPRAIDSLPSHERAFINDYRSTLDEIIKPYVSDTLDDPRPLIRVDMPHGSEIYNWQQGAKIVKARNYFHLADELHDIVNVVKNPQHPISVDELVERLANSRVLNDPKFPKSMQALALQGYTFALIQRGVDAREVAKLAIQSRYGAMKPSVIAKAADLSKRFHHPIYTADDLLDAIQPVYTTTTNRQIRQNITSELRPLREAIHGGKWGRVRVEFRRVWNLIDKGKLTNIPDTFANLDRFAVERTLDLFIDKDRWLNLSEVRAMASPKMRNVAAKTAARLERNTVPARWAPLVQKAIDQRMTDIARVLTDVATGSGVLDPDDAFRIVELVNRNREYRQLQKVLDELNDPNLPATWEALYRGTVAEMRGTWRELASNGFDPVFVHHVGIGRAHMVHFPGVRTEARTPGHWQERTLNFAPHEGDLSLALHHQMMEILVKKGEDHMVDLITYGSKYEGWRPVAKSYGELVDLMRPIIERHQSHHRGMSFEQAAQQVIGRTWVRWDHSKFKNFGTRESPMYPSGGRGRPGVPAPMSQAEHLYVPRNIWDALQDFQRAPRVTAVWDPVMNVFRTSTLILSPRWHVYNLLGNMLNVTTSEGFGWVKHLPEAWKAANAVRREVQPSGLTPLPHNIRLSLGQARVEQVTYNEFGRAAMDQLRTKLDDIAPGTSQKLLDWGKPLGRQFNRLTDFSLRMNAMVDDAARIAGWLSAYDRYMKKKPSYSSKVERWLLEQDMMPRSWSELARIQAERDMRKWAYNWDSLTPWERSAARFMFPFYGFFSHILRYAAQYTIDHPFRMALVAAFARNELEDWGTGLPAYLHNLVIVSAPDEKGFRKALNFGGWNPFADTANLLTLTGWMSQANPIISTLAQQFGIDPRTGEASLYPTARFNEQTGRLELSKPSFFQSAVQNLIPQTQAVFNLAGVNPDFNRLAVSNPQAAHRLLATSVGIPVLVRDVNPIQEVAKAEMARRNAAKQALSEALRSGSTSVPGYPSLTAQLQALRSQADPQMLQRFRPPVDTPGVLDLLRQSVRTVVGQ